MRSRVKEDKALFHIFIMGTGISLVTRKVKIIPSTVEKMDF